MVMTLAALAKEVKTGEVHGFKPFPVGSPPQQFQLAAAGQLWLSGFPPEIPDVQAALSTIPHLKLLWAFTVAGPKLTPRGLVLYSDKQILLKAGQVEQL
jgi:hypothetical protein